MLIAMLGWNELLRCHVAKVMEQPLAAPDMKVLVVEDEPISALSITWELASAGHTVIGPAPTMEDALRCVRQRRPDLALLDIELQKEGEGVELAKKLHEMDIPTVFVSGVATLARKHSELALGFIGKPFNPADISQSIAAIGALLTGQEPPASIPVSLRLFNTIPG